DDAIAVRAPGAVPEPTHAAARIGRHQLVRAAVRRHRRAVRGGEREQEQREEDRGAPRFALRAPAHIAHDHNISQMTLSGKLVPGPSPDGVGALYLRGSRRPWGRQASRWWSRGGGG